MVYQVCALAIVDICEQALIVASGLEKIEVPQSAAACSCHSVEKINWEYRSQIQPVIGPQARLLIGQIPPIPVISLAINFSQLYSISTPRMLGVFLRIVYQVIATLAIMESVFKVFPQSALLIVCLAEQL